MQFCFKLAFLYLLLSIFNSSNAAPTGDQLCSSAICKQSAQYIIDGMNSTMNPCEDFYEFACGGWHEHHTIPETKSEIGTYDSLNERMTQEIRQLLEKYNLKENENSANSSLAVSYSAYVYQSCIQLGKEPDKEGLKQLKEVVQTILGHQWSIGQTATVMRPWHDNFVRAYAQAWMSPFFKISVEPDPKNTSTRIMNIYPSRLDVGDNELKNLTENEKIISAYKNYIVSAGKLFCEDKCDSLNSDADDVILFESELAKIRMSVEEQRNVDKTYNKVTIKELSAKSKFNWFTEIIVPIVKMLSLSPSTVDEGRVILISDVNYVVNAIDILKRTPPRVVENYIGWKTVEIYGPRSSEQFRRIAYEFSKVLNGITKEPERWEICYETAYSHLSFAVSRLFVENYFTENEKAQATKLVDSIQDSYRDIIVQNKWLDQVTKNNSLKKINHMNKNVAYPNWLLHNEQLDEFYSLTLDREFSHLLMAQKNYLLSLLVFSKVQLKSEITHLNKPVDADKRWPMAPAIVNAAYWGNQNSITIPAGILKFPFFNSELPFAINYGAIGVVIGHEFTHALDDLGRKFDEFGNLKNWWTVEAETRFQNRSECFVNQYGKQVEKVTGLRLNGRSSLGENIADNGGLHESHHAFKGRHAQSSSTRLADLAKFSPEQLFFVSYANVWCSLIRPEKLKQLIEYDVHSPAQYRVNIPLSNSADFAKAFNCPLGSKMNPTDKCLLW